HRSRGNPAGGTGDVAAAAVLHWFYKGFYPFILNARPTASSAGWRWKWARNIGRSATKRRSACWSPSAQKRHHQPNGTFPLRQHLRVHPPDGPKSSPAGGTWSAFALIKAWSNTGPPSGKAHIPASPCAGGTKATSGASSISVKRMIL